MSLYQSRCDRAQAAMAAHEIDYLVVPVSSDLFYLTGYTSSLSERLTAFILPREGQATMVIPAFEAVRMEQVPERFYDVAAWTETEDPFAAVQRVMGGGRGAGLTLGIGEQMWSVFLLGIQDALPQARYLNASRIMTPLRIRKDETEIAHLLQVGVRMDQVFAEVCRLKFAGRTESAVGDDIFQIVKASGLRPTRAGGVASGPNSASAHHTSGERRIERGDALWLELGQGATYQGYLADKTRCVHVGPQSELYKRVYAVVKEAQETAFQAIRPGVQCQEVDRAARTVIERAGYGPYFTHRVGHGLGLDIHEPPYLVSGNATPVESGMVFSDEPGIYLPGQFGIRIEDIVYVTESGARRIYGSTHDCVEVE